VKRIVNIQVARIHSTPTVRHSLVTQQQQHRHYMAEMTSTHGML